jgi:hypothetical protein
MEKWQKINGVDGFLISSYGNVFNIKKNKLSKISKKESYYPSVTMNGKSYKVHRLVAEAFLEKEDGRTFVNHKDKNPCNNNVENLEWVTHRENMSHAYSLKKTSSKYTGVRWHKRDCVWISEIYNGQKQIQVGRSKCETKAYIKYMQALKSMKFINKYA